MVVTNGPVETGLGPACPLVASTCASWVCAFLQGLTRPVALTQIPGVVVTADCKWHGEAMGKGVGPVQPRRSSEVKVARLSLCYEAKI